MTNTTLEKPIKANPNVTSLHHSDRGFTYLRTQFKQKLEKLGMAQSMSRVSRCIDNGSCESFQWLIKDILFVLNPNLKTYEELVEAIYKTYE